MYEMDNSMDNAATKKHPSPRFGQDGKSLACSEVAPYDHFNDNGFFCHTNNRKNKLIVNQ
jgi:hypothetical protein